MIGSRFFFSKGEKKAILNTSGIVSADSHRLMILVIVGSSILKQSLKIPEIVRDPGNRF